MKWIIGTSCTSGHNVAFPLNAVSFILSIEKWRDEIKEKLAEASNDGANIKQKITNAIPASIMHMLAEEGELEIPEEVVNEIGKNCSTRVDFYAGWLAATVVMVDPNGNLLPLKAVNIIEEEEFIGMAIP